MSEILNTVALDLLICYNRHMVWERRHSLTEQFPLLYELIDRGYAILWLLDSWKWDDFIDTSGVFLGGSMDIQ